MTEYQKGKLDQLIEWLENEHHSNEKWFILNLAEEIRDKPCPKVEENKAESSIMDAYFQGKRLELFQSAVADGTPFVCPGDDVYACAGMSLDRFVELLDMRKKYKEFLSTCNRRAFAEWVE